MTSETVEEFDGLFTKKTTRIFDSLKFKAVKKSFCESFYVMQSHIILMWAVIFKANLQIN